MRRWRQHCFRKWLVACPVPSHYMNQCWPIVIWTIGSKLPRNSNWNKIFSFIKMRFKVSSAKWRSFLSGSRVNSGIIRIILHFVSYLGTIITFPNMNDKDQCIPHKHDGGCWWPDDAWMQDSSTHCICWLLRILQFQQKGWRWNLSITTTEWDTYLPRAT